MLLVRLVSADGSDPIIMDRAENVTLFEAVNSSDEGTSFEISKIDSKAIYANPEVNSNYARICEVWDTESNRRLNRGPIKTIEDAGQTWKISASGRSQFLEDIKSTHKTFYAPIAKFIDMLRYENVVVEPRTQTLVWSGEDDTTDNVEESTFDHPQFDDTFYKLSKFSKDNVSDDENGLIPVGKIEPSRGFYTTKSFWSGTNKEDTLIVDLGQDYPISKLRLLFPWWGGKQRVNNRTYDFDLAIARTLDDNVYTASGYWGTFRTPVWDDSFNTIYRTGQLATGSPNRLVTVPSEEMDFNLGYLASGAGYATNTYDIVPSQAGPITTRFIRVAIKDVNAWYGSVYDSDPGHNGYDYQCDPAYTAGTDSFFGNKRGIMKNAEFNDQTLEASSDCHASIVEIGAFQEIVPKAEINPLAVQKIDSNNLQITYHHSPVASETRTLSSGLRRYEPGNFFRRATVTFSGASSNFHKFFTSDCSNCYPDGFHFGVQDSNQNAILMTDASSGTEDVRSGIYSKFLLMKGAANATVTEVDCWLGQSDDLSYGGSYAFSEVEDDYAIVHFRGRSFKWFATVPASKTGAQVNIEIRHKIPGAWQTGVAEAFWSGWTTLETNYQLPNDIHGEQVYEITYESGTLLADTVYEIRITNADGGYCSIDSIEGYWSGSFTMYNEDSTRIRVSNESAMTQIYDKRFSNGSMYKWNTSGAGVSMVFEGDRLIIVSAKGHNQGKLRLGMYNYNTSYGLYDSGLSTDRIFIPGGNTDGSLTIDTSKGKKANESTQNVIFDSNSSFPNGLPWGKYGFTLLYSPADTYSATVNDAASNNFRHRCSNCRADASGSRVINKHVYLDSIGVHEAIGLSIVFENKSNLEQLQSVAEALQVEWSIGEEGLIFAPRTGEDTDFALREGENTLVDYQIVHDVSKVATMLYSSGADIDGLPLFTITEDKKAREILGRTVMQDQDFRDIGSYQQLIGLSRGELRRRREPEKRIQVTHLGDLDKPLNKGDSFNLVTKANGTLRVRILKKQRNQSTSGTTYNLECTRWPVII